MNIKRVENAISASAVIGINAGYGHKNDSNATLSEIAELLKKKALKVEDETGIYVSGVIYGSKCYYKTEWGCPEGGEDTFCLNADCNPSYSSLPAEEYIKKWQVAFLRLVELLMEELEQSAVTAKVGSEVLYLSR